MQVFSNIYIFNKYNIFIVYFKIIIHVLFYLYTKSETYSLGVCVQSQFLLASEQTVLISGYEITTKTKMYCHF